MFNIKYNSDRMLKKIILVLIMLLIIAIPSILLAMSDNYFSERTDIYIKQHVKEKTSDIYAKVIKEEFKAIYDVEELVSYKFNNNNEIESVLINSAKVNDIIYIASSLISQSIKEGVIEKELEQISFPIGQLISKSIFAGEGPDVHIEVDPITSYEVDIETNMQEYGINNMIFEIYLVCKIEMEVMIPLKQEKIVCDNKTLILSQILPGKIPYFYYKA